jgi:hypothetical protein
MGVVGVTARGKSTSSGGVDVVDRLRGGVGVDAADCLCVPIKSMEASLSIIGVVDRLD